MLLSPQAGKIASPSPSAISRPFWDGCERGELLFQRCKDCEGITHTPAVICAHCTSRALVWERSNGTGTIYSWTTIWRPQTPAYSVPYVNVIVDVDEGWQMLAGLVGCEHDAAAIGMPVTVDFHPLHDGFVLPYFRPLVPFSGPPTP